MDDDFKNKARDFAIEKAREEAEKRGMGGMLNQALGAFGLGGNSPRPAATSAGADSDEEQPEEGTEDASEEDPDAVDSDNEETSEDDSDEAQQDDDEQSDEDDSDDDRGSSDKDDDSDEDDR